MGGVAGDKPESSNDYHGLRILPKYKDDTRISLMARAFSKCCVGFMLCNALVLDLCGGSVHMVFGEWHWKDSLTPVVF